MIRAGFRGVRGDLRIAKRPASAIVIVGVFGIACLLSLMMQQAQHGQLDVAAWGLEHMESELNRCGADDDRCIRVGEQDVKFASRFLQEQTVEAERIGQLQNVGGALRFGSATAGLAVGFLAILALATLTLTSEWSRGTFGYALAGGWSPLQVAIRRLVSLAILGLLVLASALGGSLVAALLGDSTFPLPDSANSVPGWPVPLVGAIVVVMAFAAVATTAVWFTRAATSALLLGSAIIAAIALTTPFGPAAPGSWIAGALDIGAISEMEIGYLWFWPNVDFDIPGARLRVPETPSWLMSISGVGLILGVAVLALTRHVGRDHDPLD